MSAISREAASLIRTERGAALATLDEGWPLASMVAYVLEEEHCGLLFFLRQLSQHTPMRLSHPSSWFQPRGSTDDAERQTRWSRTLLAGAVFGEAVANNGTPVALNVERSRDGVMMCALSMTNDEVARKLQGMWADVVDRARVRVELDRYGLEPHEREVARVHLAILRLCQGATEKVAEFVAAAKRDYRDVLMWAEYPAEGRAVWAVRQNLTEEEKRRLEELRREDRRQYQEWLER